MDTTALALPDEETFKRAIDEINRFQAIVHANLKENLDYGVIPGTRNEPTLLKAGAEKIIRLLGLADSYEIVDRKEEWEANAPFFRYLVKCQLTHLDTGKVVTEGFGECNSLESKYRWRWCFGSEVPPHLDKDVLYQETRQSKRTEADYIMYRVPNDEVFSQVNTILKMSKKRSLVDAALSAGRLSDVFTQDLEDIPSNVIDQPEKPQAKKPKPQETVKAEEETPEDLTKLRFANTGAFYTACYRYLGLVKTKVDSEVPEYDLSKPDQRAKAWLSLVEAHKTPNETPNETPTETPPEILDKSTEQADN